MIKLLENGALKVVKIYNTIYSARIDLRQRDKEKYLVEYCDNIYSIGNFFRVNRRRLYRLRYKNNNS